MPQVYISPNDFLFRSNPFYPYFFFSIISLLLIAGLFSGLFFVQLKKTEGSTGVHFSNIHKSYLYSSLCFSILAIILSIFLLVRFFLIFSIGSSIQTSPSIMLFGLLVIGLGLSGLDIIFIAKDLNKGIYCPTNNHLNQDTLQCIKGCNGDDGNCESGWKCRGNDCCPPEKLCGQAGCCSQSDCHTFTKEDGTKFDACCSKPCIKTGGDPSKAKCCGALMQCDTSTGECVAECGYQDNVCNPGEYCMTWDSIDISRANLISCPDDKKYYDDTNKNLYCCFPTPDDSKDCVPQAVTLSVPDTGNYTSCFTRSGVDDVDQKTTVMLESGSDFSSKGQEITNKGENVNKSGYMCGINDSLQRGYQTVYASKQSGACKDQYYKCQNDITTKTQQSKWVEEEETGEYKSYLYCNQLINCSEAPTEKKTNGPSDPPAGYTWKKVNNCPDGLCGFDSDNHTYKDPSQAIPPPPKRTDSNQEKISQYLFNKDCKEYKNYSVQGEACEGTVLKDESSAYSCASSDASPDPQYKYIKRYEIAQKYCMVENGSLVCKPATEGEDTSRYATCDDLETCNRLITTYNEKNSALIINDDHCTPWPNGDYWTTNAPKDAGASQWFWSGGHCDFGHYHNQYWGNPDSGYCPPGTRPFYWITGAEVEKENPDYPMCNNAHDAFFTTVNVSCCDGQKGSSLKDAPATDQPTSPYCLNNPIKLTWKAPEKATHKTINHILLGRTGTENGCSINHDGCDQHKDNCHLALGDRFNQFNNAFWPK